MKVAFCYFRENLIHWIKLGIWISVQKINHPGSIIVKLIGKKKICEPKVEKDHNQVENFAHNEPNCIRFVV